MQNHHLPARMGYGKKSEAYWALRPVGSAVVFVHGFGGSATQTWLNFPLLLRQAHACAGHDFLFYGYDGLKIRAYVSARQLVTFLDDLLRQPANVASKSLATVNRPQDFAYSRLVLVGHSLGAVVARMALISAHREGREWLDRVSLVLFAPAHNGAHILRIASLAMGVLRLAPVEALARYRFQVLQDLEAGCKTLTDLADQTRREVQSGAKYLVARHVMYAYDDKIVNPGDFCEDPPADIIPGTTHTSICKPRGDFQAPLLELLRFL